MLLIISLVLLQSTQIFDIKHTFFSKKKIYMYTSKVLEVSVVEFPVLLLEFEDTVSFLPSLSDFSSELIHSISASKPVGYPIACSTCKNYIKIQFYSNTRHLGEQMKYWEQQFQPQSIWAHDTPCRKRRCRSPTHPQVNKLCLPGHHHGQNGANLLRETRFKEQITETQTWGYSDFS